MAGIKEEKKIYLVGIYCRLSKDDGTDNESASIATQKSILTDYVKKQGWHLAKTYVDDGYSGTNFQRPSFQNMIKDIENGLINCVITKDLSRLGRNYLDCGLYLEVFFPEHNVRYIAVNDGVDTLNKSAMDITPFRNILNEMYSADVSVKIKSAYRARFQQGKFMGTTAPYGYVKDPADHNHLLIDDKVAHVVREIFDLALAGNGIAKIRKHINKQHILRPAAYAAEQGATGYERYFEENEENRYIWSENSVRGILRSPIYAGNLAGYKRIAANMKSKKRPSKLPEEWEVIPDTHEGIVTQEEFDTVQQLITSRRLPENKGGFENIFAGVIKCADCGYAMRAMSANRRKRPDIIDCVQYSCNNYGRYGNIMCTAHSIEARDLFNAVLTDINRFADMAVNDEKAVRAIEKRLTETDHSRAKALEKEQRKLNKRLAELDRLFSSLYEDKVMERITERNFEMMSGKYQKEQLEIVARLKEVTETLGDSYEKSQGVRDFLSLIRNYQGIKELDATIINALIDKILVSEREKLADGTVRQEIKIYYKFIGFVGELHITPTKRWTALKPKNCTVCGVEYVPRSGISKYCPACAKKIQREKSNESKRRSRERNRQACIELSAKNDRLMLIAEKQAEQKSLKMNLIFDKTLPAYLIGDVIHIKQILLNLINNAVKYTKEGQIDIKVSKNAEETKLIFEVKDTGIGIKEENLPVLFDAFMRVDSKKNKKIKGTGLGLAIAKQLAEQMDGMIWVESVYGKGSSFFVQLPMKKVSDGKISNVEWKETDERKRRSFVAPQAKILIVDDNPENLMVTRSLLKRTAVFVDTAASGEECVHKVRQNIYDLILLDYMMPQMDGIDTIRELKKDVQFHIPVIALTADVTKGIEQTFLREGFCAYLSKPVMWSKLEDLLMKYLRDDLVFIREDLKEEQKIKDEEFKQLKGQLKENDIKIEEGLRLLDGDFMQYRKLMEFFMEYQEEYMRQMQQLMTQKEVKVDEITRMMHTLKSNAKAIGAIHLYEIAKEMEDRGKQKDMEYIMSAYDLLKLEWGRVFKASREFIEQTKNVLFDQKKEEEKDKQSKEEIKEKLKIFITRYQAKEAKEQIQYYRKGKISEEERNILKEMEIRIDQLDFDEAEILMKRWEGME